MGHYFDVQVAKTIAAAADRLSFLDPACEEWVAIREGFEAYADDPSLELEATQDMYNEALDAFSKFHCQMWVGE